MDDKPRRFYALDVMRGAASLSVVLFHYQHFFFEGTTLSAGFSSAALPFYPALSLIYERGPDAVRLFFVLSGFILFELYRERVSARTISALRFAVLRFSRLYPLHLATLIVVAAGQWLACELGDGFWVYPYNDAKHFALNLALASHWGFEDGFSFNGPSWSVSVEAVLYALFFVLARAGLTSLPGTVATAAAGIVVALFTPGDLGTAVFCFFLGGAVQQLYTHLRDRIPLAWVSAGVLALAAALVVTLELSPLAAYRRLPLLALYGGMFPALVLCLAALQDVVPDLGQRWRWLGDISYATYMLHFPLTLFVILISKHCLPLNPASGVVFFSYFALLVPLSLATHHYLERPVQSLLRSAWQRSERGGALAREAVRRGRPARAVAADPRPAGAQEGQRARRLADGNPR